MIDPLADLQYLDTDERKLFMCWRRMHSLLDTRVDLVKEYYTHAPEIRFRCKSAIFCCDTSQHLFNLLERYE